MPELIPTLIVVGVILLAFVGMFLGYRGRLRRQATLGSPTPVPENLGPARSEREMLYVSTTLRDQPLERVAVAGLGMRARADLAVHAEGAVLTRQGSDPVFIPSAAVQAVDRSTVTIDKVVERDGLVRVGWLLGDTPVDTYLRAGTPTATEAAVEELRHLLHSTDTDRDPAHD